MYKRVDMNTLTDSASALRRRYENLFIKEFEKLNEEQKKAVSTIEGPVLVNAGPGTGKTQILAVRIGKILLETDAAAHNILCLTYTEAATVAMRNRLVEIIGPAAHQVHIHTFHGFCNKVIQENLNIFGAYRQLEPITDLETVDIFRALIDSLPSDNILKRFKDDRYYEKDRMQNLFDLMKKENISSEELIALVDRHLKEKRESDEYIAKRASTSKGRRWKKGEFRQDKYENYAIKFDTLKAAAKEYQNYQDLMQEHERYDYNDMILWVLEEFKQNELLLSQYQERYQYFLVDEYQDTNGSQNAILSLLIDYWDQANVFVVGDDDQAIYKFQGASIDNLVKFRNDYNPEIIVLKKNYRSNQKILDSASSLIQLNTKRLVNEDEGLSKQLQASGDDKDNTSLPKVICFNKQSDEYAFIADQLKKMALENPEELKETAVIYRKHKQVESLLTILEKNKIAYNVKHRINILELPFIKNLINILKYIQEEYDVFNSSSVRLFEILHYEYFKIPSLDIARLNYYCSRHRKNKERISLREFIADKEKIDTLGLSQPEKIHQLSQHLESWIGSQASKTIQLLFGDILNEGGILSYIMERPDKAWYLQLIATLFDFIKDESVKSGNISLKEVLQMFDKMNENRIQLPVNKIISSENGVHFVTAHSAKGLEFKNVFLIGCTKNIWDKTGGSHFVNYTYPDGVNSSNQTDTEDERRLFFVALTRAKTGLTVSYARQTEEGKDLGASQFVDEMVANGGIEMSTIEMPEDKLIKFYYEVFKKTEVQVPLIEKPLIDNWLKDYRLSVTHLNKYLSCPISFYFENILRVPSARNAYTGYGSAMHNALYEFMMQYKAKKLSDKGHLVHYFRDSMNKHRSHFTKEEFESYLVLGEMNLEKLHADRIDEWTSLPDFALEEELSHAEAEGVAIKGFIDKVEIDKQKVHVVDYKTGKASNAKKKLKKPSDKDPVGGDYWRQLVFYKILLESDKKHNWIMESAEIDFIEPDRVSGEFTRKKMYVTDEDTAIVKRQIKECYEKIKNYAFDKGCGEDDCRWCSFVNENKLSIAQ